MDDKPLPVHAQREDGLAWYARVQLPRSSKSIELAFPKSSKFIQPVPGPDANRLVKMGWDIPRTLFLDTPYLFTFLPYAPAQAASWIIDVQEKLTCFKVVAFWRGYVSQAPRIGLEGTILREMEHLKANSVVETSGELPSNAAASRSAEGRATAPDGAGRPPADEVLVKKYGLERTFGELRTTEEMARRELVRRPLIFGVVMEFWLGRYCSEQAEKLAGWAEPLPPAMQGGKWALSWKDIESAISKIYEQYLGKQKESPGSTGPS